MRETITAMDMRQKLGEILNRVDLRHDQFIIERKGKALAALVPIELLKTIQIEARKGAASFLERIATDLSEEEAMSIAQSEKKAARKKKHSDR